MQIEMLADWIALAAYLRFVLSFVSAFRYLCFALTGVQVRMKGNAFQFP
jgi:hypothetical protein